MQWVKSKPGTSNSAAKACSPPVKLEVKPETVDAALYEDLMEVEDFAVPASSDPLWAAIDGDGGDAFIAALDQMEADAAEDPDAVEEDERYKPFFTGGQSSFLRGLICEAGALTAAHGRPLDQLAPRARRPRFGAGDARVRRTLDCAPVPRVRQGVCRVRGRAVLARRHPLWCAPSSTFSHPSLCF